MNRIAKGRGKSIFLIIAVTTIVFSSCKTTRDFTVEELRPMSVNRIIRRVERAAPDYLNYESKRIAVVYNDSGERNSFSAQLVLDKDKEMLLTIRKLNIPLGRGLLTPDSIIVVNYFDRNFIRDEISASSQLFGFNFDFEILQAILTADVSRFVDSELVDKNLVSEVDMGMYRVNSQFSKRIDKAVAEGNERRLSRYMQRMDDSEFINYSVWIDPRDYVIKKIILHNIKLNETVTVLYSDYEKIGRSLFPQTISFSLNGEKQNINVDMGLSRTTVNKSQGFTINIPEQYEQYHIRRKN